MCLGIPGQIVEITDETRLMAMADVSGVKREVSIAPVLGAGMKPADVIGEYALIHVGFAMALIDEHEAAETLKALEGLGEAQETLDAMAEGAKALEGQA
ncbi:MAG TPA: hydrogenase formation protein HypC [Maritimibacter sp.]|nr:hydrogenase formation protein HypC [Maritimibacter sp.]